MLATVFMDKLMSMGMSLSVLIGAFVLLFFAYRSNSDGKAIIKNAIQKRNLFIEIVLFFMAIIVFSFLKIHENEIFFKDA